MRCLAILVAWTFLASSAAIAQQTTAPPNGDGRIAGRVLTESGSPIGGAVVTAFLFTTEPQASARYTTTTGRDGGYVLERLPPGRFRVIAEKQLFEPGGRGGTHSGRYDHRR